jgi:hypothetical protein
MPRNWLSAAKRLFQVGLPSGTPSKDQEEFRKELKKFEGALGDFSKHAQDGTDAQLEASFSAVHDSFEMLVECCRESENRLNEKRLSCLANHRASSVGTMIEWYDFYIFGSLATVISPLFYPQGNNTIALIAYLSTFAVGFVVRPFGALFFGRIGDLVGRKYAFLVTLLIMGGATALIGFLPTYATIGIAAPILLLADPGLAGFGPWR